MHIRLAILALVSSLGAHALAEGPSSPPPVDKATCALLMVHARPDGNGPGGRGRNN